MAHWPFRLYKITTFNLKIIYIFVQIALLRMFCFIQHSLNTDTPISHIPSSKVSYQHSTHNSYLFVAVSTPQAVYIVANTITFFYFIFITLILYSHFHKIRSFACTFNFINKSNKARVLLVSTSFRTYPSHFNANSIQQYKSLYSKRAGAFPLAPFRIIKTNKIKIENIWSAEQPAIKRTC